MPKKYRTGLVIGKFYPFHNGHRYLIETALKDSEVVTVILCQTDQYRIPPEIRAGWIKSTFPTVDVRILHHDASLDSDSTDISEKWAKITLDFLGFVPDVVFSSEKYGQPYATFMGSQHVLVDLERKRVPISATLIRSDIDKYWHYLPEASKRYFIAKIVVLGAESTGTTTLAKDLATHYRTVWVPEYGRTYYEGKMYSENISSWNTSEFIHIAKSQNRLEDALRKQASKLLVCDTDALATTVWHERYVGSESKELDQVVKKEKPLLYILTDVDIPFVQDGTRDGEYIRTKMHLRFIEKLTENKSNFIIVSGSKEKRLADAVTQIDRAFSIFSHF